MNLELDDSNSPKDCKKLLKEVQELSKLPFTVEKCHDYN